MLVGYGVSASFSLFPPLFFLLLPPPREGLRCKDVWHENETSFPSPLHSREIGIAFPEKEADRRMAMAPLSFFFFSLGFDGLRYIR